METPKEPTPDRPDPPGRGPAGADFGERFAGLPAADLILVVAGGLYVVSTFLPWYEASIGPAVSVGEGAWNVGALGVMAALLGLATAALAVATSFGLWRIGQQSAALLAAVLAPATLFFTFLRLVIDPPGEAIAQFTLGFVNVSRGIGLWAAFVLAIVMTAAAILKYRSATAAG